MKSCENCDDSYDMCHECDEDFSEWRLREENNMANKQEESDE